MTLERAISMLEAEYEKAQKLRFVHNPIAWALFRVWKVADRGGVKNEHQKEAGRVFADCK